MRIPPKKRKAKKRMRHKRMASLLRNTPRDAIGLKLPCQGHVEIVGVRTGLGRADGNGNDSAARTLDRQLMTQTILHQRRKLSAPRERLPAEYPLGRRASCGVCPLSAFRGACVCA